MAAGSVTRICGGVLLCICVLTVQPRTTGAADRNSAETDAKTLAAEKDAFDRVCGACHSTTMIDELRSEPEWRETVDVMIQTGAKGSAEDFERVMRYLARNWTKIEINKAAAGQIADALGVSSELATAVVSYRSEHGSFANLADLQRVPGMTKVDLDTRKERIVF